MATSTVTKTTAPTTQSVIEDLRKIQKIFSMDHSRYYKGDLLAKFVGRKKISTEATDLAIDAVDRAYKAVVWADDVRGSDIYMMLEATIVRVRVKGF